MKSTRIPDEAHLAALLDNGNQLSESTSLRERRLCAMHVLDYYQATLREAAEKIDLPVSVDRIGDAVDGLLAAMPGLDHVEHLRGLRQFRNNVYHNEQHSPEARQLKTYLKLAEPTRAALIKGTTDIVARRRTMSELGQRLDKAQRDLDSIIPRLPKKAQEYWRPKSAEAKAMKQLPDLGIGAIDLLLEINGQVAGFEAEADLIASMHESGPDYDYEPPEPDYEPEPPEPDYDYEPPEPDYEPEPPEPDYDEEPVESDY